ncbi:hypothetical protein BKA65DRAFT_555971 [Rhexocercosporidium sp. MPI-PUGE-AT-0058]|nr:hypothetical protein BKA65DRAFT_555971 [Rhexocercosporidium sp. MPI-PUGE-AT-0058]
MGNPQPTTHQVSYWDNQSAPTTSPAQLPTYAEACEYRIQLGEEYPATRSYSRHIVTPTLKDAAKARLYSLRTLPESKPRRHSVRLPPNTTQDAFDAAIDALVKVLGVLPTRELAVTGKPRTNWYTGSGRSPREAVREGVKALPVGDVSWVFYGTQYGDTTSIASQLDIIKSEFSKISGSKFMLPAKLPPDHYIHSRVQVCSGVPVLKELDWLNWKPNAAHLFFSPITPTDSKNARPIHDLIDKLHQKWGFDTFPTLCVAGREIHYIANIVYDRATRTGSAELEA